MARGRIWWPEFAFSIPWPISRLSGINFSVASSIIRWPLIDFSQFSFRSWFDDSVDNVVWTFVTVIETVALVAMLCVSASSVDVPSNSPVAVLSNYFMLGFLLSSRM